MKRIIILALAFMLMLLSGCQSKTFSLGDGRYVLEQFEEEETVIPYLIIQEDNLDVIQAIAVSYQPSGAMVINGNEVVMETVFAGEPYKWTFKLIDNNKLKFIPAKSDIPYNGEIWEDGMVFVLAEKESVTQTTVPEDFSFALTWNCYGVSSYDSQTGKLVKTTDATNPDDYVTKYQLTDEDKENIYNLLESLDVNSFPDVYTPNNGMSKPSMTLVLTVRINGTVKTITAENIAFSFVSEDEKGQQFLSVCEAISNRLTATEEWKALPDYEVLYE